MFRRTWWWCFLLALLAVPATAQDVLPPAFAGWNSHAIIRVRPDALEQFVAADAAVLREYGAVSAERGAYTRGGDTLGVTLYRMEDATAAYGAYSFLRSREMRSANLGAFSSIAPKHGLIVVGNLLLDVTGPRLESLVGDLEALVRQIEPRAEKNPYPNLSQYLPTTGLVADSERYFLGPVALNRFLPLGIGDWIGFADGAEAQLARYTVNGEEMSLLLAAYPTPQAAARKMDELGRWLNLNRAEEVAAGRPMLFGRRVSSLVVLVAGTRSQAAADLLLKQVRVDTQVTWNEPGYKASEPGLLNILVGTFIGTGVILVFALAAGIGFGGFRLLVKFFLPGKVFDRPSSVEIIQLGLTSKPIEGKDFY